MIYTIFYNIVKNNPPKPHAFVCLPMQSLIDPTTVNQFMDGWNIVHLAYLNLCDCYGYSMSACGINIHDTSNGWNVAYGAIVNYYPELFPQGGNTILTEEIYTRLAADINHTHPYHQLGFSLPSFRDLICLESTRYNAELPHGDFISRFRDSGSPTLAKILEMDGKVNFLEG